ncbi:MAG: DedA family protein [Rickettsiales bacterium]|jgi:membrane protein YqaA with SNARE-associated domain|nr:DedA family protein [Rickettsiales bacterium]
MSELFFLFITSFIAATIIPTGSEAMLAGLVKYSHHDAFLLLVIATTGNVAGSIINWLIGVNLLHLKDKKFFPLTPKTLTRATKYYQRFGIWSLLFAWLPIIGDPLTLIAGVLRTKFLPFIILVTIGKTLRYYVIILFIL